MARFLLFAASLSLAIVTATPSFAQRTPDRPAQPVQLCQGCTIGTATYASRRLQGRRTASGEAYDSAELTAASRTLPLQSRVRVVNLANGRSVVVRINDRGPRSRPTIDVSQAAARELDMIRAGRARVRLEPVRE